MINYNEEYSKPNTTRNLKEGRKIDLSNEPVITFLRLWKYIGYIGFLLPLGILFLTFLFKYDKILPSISDYYYSMLSNLFIGCLTIIFVFLISNHVNNIFERIISQIAGICALLIAIFPTPVLMNFELKSNAFYTKDELDSFVRFNAQNPKYVGYLHFIFAALFFIMLIVLIFKFFIPNEKNSNTHNKNRVVVYKICGFTMTFSIIAIAILKLFWVNLNLTNPETWVFPYVFSLETVSLFAFGTAWLVKGNAFEEFLDDDKEN